MGRRAKDWGYVYTWCDPRTKSPTKRVPKNKAEWKAWGKAMRAVETANARLKAHPVLRCGKRK